VQRETTLIARLPAGEGGFDGLTGAAKDGEDAVAQELPFDRRAGMLADDSPERAVEVARSSAEGSVTQALGEGCGVDDVGEEDRRHAGGPLDTFRVSKRHRPSHRAA